MNFCNNCGEKVNEDEQHCMKCGKLLKAPRKTFEFNNVKFTRGNFNIVGQFIKENLFLFGIINLLVFILLSISLKVGWFLILGLIITVYLYPLLTGNLKTSLDKKIRDAILNVNNSVEQPEDVSNPTNHSAVTVSGHAQQSYTVQETPKKSNTILLTFSIVIISLIAMVGIFIATTTFDFPGFNKPEPGLDYDEDGIQYYDDDGNGFKFKWNE